ncbi:MAG: hypothetical protein HQ561_08810, partial [Desulfobacteraceae bacterium]|nr:hypothetical protein [Desulfobacteraceae bacterium]
QPLIGRTERGFDFLGYHFGPEGLAIAYETIERFRERIARLYEQGPGDPCGSNRLGEYAERWVRWVGSGLGKAGVLDLREHIVILEQDSHLDN